MRGNFPLTIKNHFLISKNFFFHLYISDYDILCFVPSFRKARRRRRKIAERSDQLFEEGAKRSPQTPRSNLTRRRRGKAREKIYYAGNEKIKIYEVEKPDLDINLREKLINVTRSIKVI